MNITKSQWLLAPFVKLTLCESFLAAFFFLVYQASMAGLIDPNQCVTIMLLSSVAALTLSLIFNFKPYRKT